LIQKLRELSPGTFEKEATYYLRGEGISMKELINIIKESSCNDENVDGNRLNQAISLIKI